MADLRAPAHPVTPSHRRRVRGLGVAGSVAAALLIWIIAVPVAGVELQATSGPGSTELVPVLVGAVIAMSLLAPLAGWALLALLERFTGKAKTIWTAIAIAVLTISYGGPLLGAGIPGSSRLTLALLHTAVGLIVITTFTRSSRNR